MKNKYSEELSKVKAPRSLIEATKAEARKELARETEDKKVLTIPAKKRKSYHQIYLSAALLLIVIGTASYLTLRDQVNVETVQPKMVTINPNLGHATENNAEGDSAFQVKEGESADIIPEFLNDVKDSKVKGRKVKIAISESGEYFAVYKKDNNYVYITASDVSKKEFIDFLKNKI